MTNNQLGQYLRNLRDMKGLSTRQLARAANCSQSLITRLETGDRSPSLNRLWEIVKALEGDFGEALFLLCLDTGIPEEMVQGLILKQREI